MHNIALIVRHDVASLFRNIMSVIITLGLVILPSLFAWYNVLACWDVFNNTGNLVVAVANDDAGYESELVPINVNIGEKVVGGLRGNDQIGWVFTSSDDAIEGVHDGRYYAALVIPANFSEQLLTFYEGDSSSATIDYYVNEKKNAIAPNITNTGADMVSTEVNKVFAQTMSEVATAVAQSLANRADQDDVDGRFKALSNRMRDVGDRFDKVADVLGLYSALAGDSGRLLSDSAQLVQMLQDQAASAASGVSDSRNLGELATRLAAASDGLSQPLAQAKNSLAALQAKADALISGSVDDVSVVAGELRTHATEISDRAAQVSALKATLEQLRDELQEGIAKAIEDEKQKGEISDEFNEQLTIQYESFFALDKAIAALSKSATTLQEASTAYNTAADDLEAGSASINEKAQSLRGVIQQASADLDAVSANVVDTLKPTADALKADVETLSVRLADGATRIESMGSDLPDTLNSASTALGGVADKIDGSASKLRNAGQSMRNVASSIDAALSSGDMDTLKSLLAENSSDVATAISAPVHVDRQAIFPVDGFGSAMAPLYCSLALFIGALLIMVATKPEVSPRLGAQLVNPKPRHLYFGRFGVVALMSLAQTTLMALGNVLFLKVQVNEPLLYFVCFWFSGLVFAFIAYTLVVSFANLGKAILVLLLIIQVTACNGSYPLQLLPDFVQAISPFVPATYVVNAMRAAMFGVFQNDFWISIGMLALFILPFLLLGLVLRKPTAGFMKFYVSKVEESNLVD